MKKFKLPLAVIAVMIAITGAFAFKSQHAPVKKDPVFYHYTSGSDDIIEMRKIANWEVVEVPTGCGNTGDLPCSKEVEEEDDVAFQAYLNTFTEAEDLALDATTRKN